MNACPDCDRPPAARVLCAECGHMRAEHHIDLESCRAFTITNGVMGECPCRGYMTATTPERAPHT